MRDGVVPMRKELPQILIGRDAFENASQIRIDMHDGPAQRRVARACNRSKSGVAAGGTEE